jgi:hypothetical protein
MQIISHKYLRPLVPFLMIFSLVFNVAALFSKSTGSPWLSLQPPIGYYFLSLQLLFYLLAVVGGNQKTKGLFGRLLYLPTYLIASNYAALLGLFRYLAGKQTALWKKVAR